MSYYIYVCYSFEGKALYVGKSKDLKRRIKEHEKKSKWISDVKFIIYSRLKTNVEMGIYELYYISKFRPKYNIMDNNDDEDIDLELEPLEFEHYSEFKNIKVLCEEEGLKNFIKKQSGLSELSKILKVDLSNLYSYVDYIANLNKVKRVEAENLILNNSNVVVEFFEKEMYFPDIFI